MHDTRGTLAPESVAFMQYMATIKQNSHCTAVSMDELRKELEVLVILHGGERETLPLIEDILITSQEDKNSFYVRVYHPQIKKTLPLVLYIHGGGWSRGNLQTHDKLCRSIAKHCNVRIVSVDYRLAPEHPFPQALHDVKTAYHWCLDHQADLAFEHIAVMGDSGGATLAASLVCCLKSQAQPLPKVLVLFYPSLDLTGGSPSMEHFASGCFLTKEAVEGYVSNYIGADHKLAKDWRCSPLFFNDFHGFPTTCVLVCGADPIRDDGIRFIEKVREAGVSTEFICMNGTLHAFLQLPDFFKPQFHTALTWVQASLKKHLF